jgi:hypothetical protein
MRVRPLSIAFERLGFPFSLDLCGITGMMPHDRAALRVALLGILYRQPPL